MEEKRFFNLTFLSIFLLGLMFLFGFTFGLALETEEEMKYELQKGKNEIVFYKEMNASEIIEKNPEINVISYFDEETNKSVGFVNAFGGLGRDFRVSNETVYEVYVSADSKIRI